VPRLDLIDAGELARCPAGHDEPGFGVLATAEGHLPLRLLDVRSRVVGLAAETEVRQTFVNTLGQPLEVDGATLGPRAGRPAADRSGSRRLPSAAGPGKPRSRRGGRRRGLPGPSRPVGPRCGTPRPAPREAYPGSSRASS